MMLHTKYQDSRLYGFRQEDFFMYPKELNKLQNEILFCHERFSRTDKMDLHVLHLGQRQF